MAYSKAFYAFYAHKQRLRFKTEKRTWTKVRFLEWIEDGNHVVRQNQFDHHENFHEHHQNQLEVRQDHSTVSTS